MTRLRASAISPKDLSRNSPKALDYWSTAWITPSSTWFDRTFVALG
jgi:hypothetical protein